MAGGGGVRASRSSDTLIKPILEGLTHLAVTVMPQPDFTSRPKGELMLSTRIAMRAREKNEETAKLPGSRPHPWNESANITNERTLTFRQVEQRQMWPSSRPNDGGSDKAVKEAPMAY